MWCPFLINKLLPTSKSNIMSASLSVRAQTMSVRLNCTCWKTWSSHSGNTVLGCQVKKGSFQLRHFLTSCVHACVCIHAACMQQDRMHACRTDFERPGWGVSDGFLQPASTWANAGLCSVSCAHALGNLFVCLFGVCFTSNLRDWVQWKGGWLLFEKLWGFLF